MYCFAKTARIDREWAADYHQAFWNIRGRLKTSTSLLSAQSSPTTFFFRANSFNMAGGKKLTKEDEILLQNFSRTVSTKSSALFYANAFFVSAIPLCKPYQFNMFFALKYYRMRSLFESECLLIRKCVFKVILILC